MIKNHIAQVLEQLGLEKNNYILVSSHREENIDNDKNFISLVEALNKIAEIYGLPMICPSKASVVSADRMG